VFFLSVYLVLYAVWLNVWQYLNSTIVEIGKNTYELTYIINGVTYKMVLKPQRGPARVLLVFDGNQEDVSHEIFPYIGPEGDFHGKVYTPEVFNKKELVFQLSNGEEKIFKENDEIILK
jgi:hypothetical protein